MHLIQSGGAVVLRPVFVHIFAVGAVAWAGVLRGCPEGWGRITVRRIGATAEGWLLLAASITTVNKRLVALLISTLKVFGILPLRHRLILIPRHASIPNEIVKLLYRVVLVREQASALTARHCSPNIRPRIVTVNLLGLV